MLLLSKVMVYIVIGFSKISLKEDVQGKNRFTTVLFLGSISCEVCLLF